MIINCSWNQRASVIKATNMTVFQMIAAPADPTKKDTVNKVSEKLAPNAVADVTPFTLPEFKVSWALSIVSSNVYQPCRLELWTVFMSCRTN